MAELSILFLFLNRCTGAIYNGSLDLPSSTAVGNIGCTSYINVGRESASRSVKIHTSHTCINLQASTFRPAYAVPSLHSGDS